MNEIKKSKVKQKKDDMIIIDKGNDNIPKDYYALRRYFEGKGEEEIFDTLKVGDKVEFTPFESKGNYIAQNIKKVSEENPSIDVINKITTVPAANNSGSIVDGFISHLNTKANTINWREFEDVCLFVLKALGVSEVYPTPKDDDRGKCDGVFKILGNSTNTPRLEVFYDCTLEEDFSKKDIQIENYVAQISKSEAKFIYKLNVNNTIKSIKETISFSNTAVKQIWIITKKQTRVIENKQTSENISVTIKEVSIFDLIDIIKNKYLDKSFSKIDNILEELKNIGE